MSGILSIVEEALEIPLLWTIDDHRKGIDCTNHLAAESSLPISRRLSHASESSSILDAKYR